MTIYINILSKETIKPSRPTPTHLNSLRTSLFDQNHTPVLSPLIFYYARTLTTNSSTYETLDRLKRSLPDTLSVFYPLAGRVQDANHIKCSDEGIPYVEAKVDMPLEEVIHKAEVCQLDKLLPLYGQDGYTSLMLALQVNVFACGGLAIGVKMNHAISDAFSMLMFVKTWASIANGKDPLTLTHHPYFEIWKLFPPTSPHQNKDLDTYYDNQNPNLAPHSHVTKCFMFKEDKLLSLRSSMLSSYIIDTLHENNHGLPSLSMVLSAFIWSRIMIACHNNVRNIPCEVSHTVNLRSILNPPDEKSYYFGNMISLAILKPSLAFNEDNYNSYNNESLWHEFLKQTKKSIEKIMDKDGAFIRELEEGKKDLSFIMEYYDRKRKGEIVAMGFSNLRRLPVYEADFGWGKPVWVTTASQNYKDFVTLMDAAPSSKDIVAYVSLSHEDMAKLESDGEFIRASVPKVPHYVSKL